MNNLNNVHMDFIEFYNKLVRENVSKDCLIEFIDFQNKILISISKSNDLSTEIQDELSVTIDNILNSKFDINNELIDVKELSKKINKTPKTIYLWIRQGKVPFKKIGKEYRFYLKDVVNELNRFH